MRPSSAQPDRSLLRAIKKAGDATVGRLPVFGELWALVGDMIVPSIEDDVRYLSTKVHALDARQRHLPERIINSPEFAKRCHQVFLALARTTQEERRRYLCHALLNYGTGRFDEDETTMLLPLVESLSLRHFIVLDELLERRDAPRADANPESSNLYSVWKRIAGRFPPADDTRDGRYVYESIVADLEGRGLLDKDFSIGSMTPDRPLKPTYVARRLLEFVRDPTAASC